MKKNFFPNPDEIEICDENQSHPKTLIPSGNFFTAPEFQCLDQKAELSEWNYKNGAKINARIFEIIRKFPQSPDGIFIVYCHIAPATLIKS